MDRYPNIWLLENLVKVVSAREAEANVGGRWVPARPLGFCSLFQRFKAAKLVFTGKADAVIWPGQ